MAAGDKAVLTVDEVAALLRVHKTTVYRLLKAGKLPSFRMGSDYRFNRESIERWRLKQEFKPTPPSPSRPGLPRR